jgi:hypothetical protein
MGEDKENPGQMNREGHKEYFAGGLESSRENMGIMSGLTAIPITPLRSLARNCPMN